MEGDSKILVTHATESSSENQLISSASGLQVGAMLGESARIMHTSGSANNMINREVAEAQLKKLRQIGKKK